MRPSRRNLGRLSGSDADCGWSRDIMTTPKRRLEAGGRSCRSADVLCRRASRLGALGTYVAARLHRALAGFIGDGIPMRGGVLVTAGYRRAAEEPRVVVVIEADRRSEVTNPAPERTPDLRESLRSEHEERDRQDEEQVRGLKDVSDHPSELSSIAGDPKDVRVVCRSHCLTGADPPSPPRVVTRRGRRDSRPPPAWPPRTSSSPPRARRSTRSGSRSDRRA